MTASVDGADRRGGDVCAEPSSRQPSRHRRGLLRRVLEVRGVVGGLRAVALEARLRARDGVRLGASYLRGPAADAPAVLLVPGFAAHRRKPAYARLAEGLSAHAHVLSLDPRGHGDSGGRCTLGDREAWDVAAGVRWLRAFGHRHVCVVGLSMGGVAALHAALLQEATSSGLRPAAAPDAVVVVSSPARLGPRRTPPLRRLHALWHSPVRRALFALLCDVWLVPPRRWRRPPDPVTAAARLARPLLVVHAEDDPWFPIADAEALVAAARGPTVLWREPSGFGHAEEGVSPAFAAALGRAVGTVAGTGRFPPRERVSASGRPSRGRPDHERRVCTVSTTMLDAEGGR